MRYLGLDLGKRRTGIAFADSVDDIVFSLKTIQHSSLDDLVNQVVDIVQDRSIDEVVIGLPLLLSGEEGAQTRFSKELGTVLAGHGIPCSYIDERYTSVTDVSVDKDAAAACEILMMKLKRNTNSKY